MSGWWVLVSFIAGCIGFATMRGLERVLLKRRPPRDTAEASEPHRGRGSPSHRSTAHVRLARG